MGGMMQSSFLHKILAPLKQRILLMIGRVLILAVKNDEVMPQLTAELLQGEVLEGLQLMQQFGLASHPLPGCEGVAVFPMGDRSQRLCGGHRRQAGEARA
jgi:phage gp45-like